MKPELIVLFTFVVTIIIVRIYDKLYGEPFIIKAGALSKIVKPFFSYQVAPVNFNVGAYKSAVKPIPGYPDAVTSDVWFNTGIKLKVGEHLRELNMSTDSKSLLMINNAPHLPMLSVWLCTDKDIQNKTGTKIWQKEMINPNLNKAESFSYNLGGDSVKGSRSGIYAAPIQNYDYKDFDNGSTVLIRLQLYGHTTLSWSSLSGNAYVS
jgi:hypothetical protein